LTMLEFFPAIEAPDWGLETTPEDTIVAAQLGDGYESRAPAGINFSRDVWSMSWSSLDPAVAEATYAWLKPRKNLTAFNWINPISGVTTKVVCKSLSLTYPEWGVCNLSVTLREDFNPV
jgi:phage-related protein